MTELSERFPWLGVVLQCAAAARVGVALHAVLPVIATPAARRFALADRIVAHARQLAQCLIPLLLVHRSLADAEMPSGALESLRHVLSIAIILLFTWLVLRLIAAADDFVTMRRPVTVADKLRARTVQTQVRVLAPRGAVVRTESITP